MKIIKTILPVLCFLLLICSYFSCGNNKPADENKGSENSDTTDLPDEKYTAMYRSIIVPSDTLRINFDELKKVFECFKKCEDCTKIPCDPICDEICKEYADRSFIVPEDALKEIPPGLRNIIVLAQNAQELKLQFSYKRILSKKNSVEFNIMSAELDYMIASIDIMYKRALLNYEVNKLKNNKNLNTRSH